MTYNAHACVGMDGRLDPSRVADVVAQLRPDLLVVQEVDVGRQRSGRMDQAAELARRLDMQAHFTCAFESEGGRYGIAMMAAQGVRIEREGCLTNHGDEVRAAQWGQVSLGGVLVDVVHTHLSVRFRDRAAQLRELFGDGWIQRKLEHPHLIICGDLNALPYSSVHRALSRKLRDVQRLAKGRPRATWPSRWPWARIDHIFVGRGFEVQSCRVPRDGLSRVASDHLPLVADLVPISEVP